MLKTTNITKYRIEYINHDYYDCNDLNTGWYPGPDYDDPDCNDNIYVQYMINGINEFEPCLIFSADNYEAWINQWDFTFNGLFPYIDQSTFIELIEIDEYDWNEGQSCD